MPPHFSTRKQKQVTKTCTSCSRTATHRTKAHTWVSNTSGDVTRYAAQAHYFGTPINITFEKSPPSNPSARPSRRYLGSESRTARRCTSEQNQFYELLPSNPEPCNPPNTTVALAACFFEPRGNKFEIQQGMYLLTTHINNLNASFHVKKQT